MVGARKQLFRIEEELQKVGLQNALKTVLGYGGITNIRYPRLFEAAMSGPVGGLMGAKYLSKVIGEDNIVCSDVGGTSFDAGTITAGVLPIDREPGFQDMYVNVPMLGITSIGAGTGTYIRVDPATNRIKLGPDSAGADPGPACYGNGGPLAITDCNVVLGKLRAELFPNVFGASGTDPLDVAAARAKFEALAAEIEAATGVGQTVEAVADDGLIEAFRVDGVDGFALAVQWHPEWKVTEDLFSMAMFGAFGDACRAYREQRK